MSKSYAQVVKQIETLKQEAEKLRKAEVGGVVARIREAISHYGLSAADLGLDGKAVKGKRVAKTAAKPGVKTRKAAKPKAERVAKFRDEAGNSWGGVGKRPQWLRDALANGKTLQDFAVQA